MIYQWKEESLSFNLIGNLYVKKLFFNHKKVELFSRDANILIVPYGLILKGVNRIGLSVSKLKRHKHYTFNISHDLA